MSPPKPPPPDSWISESNTIPFIVKSVTTLIFPSNLMSGYTFVSIGIFETERVSFVNPLCFDHAFK